MGKGRSWVSPVYCVISLPNHVSCCSLKGPNVKKQQFSDLPMPVGSHVNIDSDLTGEICPSEHLEPCLAYDGWSVSG